MKKLIFYALGVLWMLTAAGSLNYIEAADFVDYPMPCYIAAVVSGLLSFAALFAAQGIAIDEGWIK